MTVTISSLTIDKLTAQPFGYDDQGVLVGRTSRKFSITGLVTPSEWLDLVDIYDTWRNTRIDEQDPAISGVLGSTVGFSGTGPGSQTWTDIECWFISAPSAEQAGAWLSVNVELVDAGQALEVILKQQLDESGQSELKPDFGTITLSSTTLTLTKPVDTYGPGPTLELTAAGTHYLSGPLTVYKIKDVEGTTNLAGWDDVRSWYESQIVAVPLTGSYFPISPPTATAERKIISGSPTDVYTVSIQLGLVM
jgi:hypothetical protein